MSEHPLICNDKEVLGLLDGSVTMLVRPIKPQPEACQCDGFNKEMCMFEFKDMLVKSPFGTIGDVLRVREAWRTTKDQDHLRPNSCCAASSIQYRADNGLQYPGEIPQEFGKWRASTTMPSLFSRLYLKVTNVQAMRVKELCVGDLRNVGVQVPPYNPNSYDRPTDPWDVHADTWNARYAHKGFGWENNPWVFIAGVERIERWLVEEASDE
jgi:hypothetical protein